MKCYQVNLDKDDRLGKRLASGEGLMDSNHSSPIQDNFLLVYHLNTANAENARGVLEKDFTKARQAGCYFLFVKGSTYGGLNREDALAIQEEYHPQVHFLSYAVSKSGGEITPIKDKWKEFFRRVEEDNQVNWDLIDSDWPENLVALYMLACAVENGDSLSETNLRGDVDTILEKANQERQMYSEQEDELRDPRIYPSPEGESWKSVIETCLREANPHANR